jgi:hypothetical protein
MCPHHAYDFDLKTGHSSTGSKACTFKMSVGDGSLWMESPGTKEEDWRVVGIRAVSERKFRFLFLSFSLFLFT